MTVGDGERNRINVSERAPMIKHHLTDLVGLNGRGVIHGHDAEVTDVRKAFGELSEDCGAQRLGERAEDADRGR